MTELDYKIKDTIDSLRNLGMQGSVNSFRELYVFAMTHLDDLKNLGLFQLSGTLFSMIAFEKISGLTRFPHMAYYALTRGTNAIQPVGHLEIIKDNWKESRAERVKLLISGGLKLIEDRLHIIDGVSRQQAYDFSILGDMLELMSLGYFSSEKWWIRAVEDTERIRETYNNLSDSDIIQMGDRIHNEIAELVYKDLKQFASDYGFVK